MSEADLKDAIRRWMNGDGSVLDDIMAKGKPAQMAVLRHADKIGSRSISVQRLGDALRKRMDAAEAQA